MTVPCIHKHSDQSELKRKDRKSSSMRHCKHYFDNTGNTDDGVKRFHGDGLLVKMDSNHHALEITGDGCRLSLSKNVGSIQVVGDGCRIDVDHNVGNIQYIGDGGQIHLGPDSSIEKVKIVGDGVKVIFDSVCETSLLRQDSNSYIKHWKIKYNVDNSTKYLKNQRKITSNCVKRTTSSCGEVIKKTSKSNECEGYSDNRTLASNQECLDNMVNDIKEKTQGIYKKANDKINRLSLYKTVTAKVITKVETNSECVRKCFGDSSSIVKSIDDGYSVKNIVNNSDINNKIK